MEHIELEYRSEIPIESYADTAKKFNLISKLTSHTKRLTFMGFLNVEDSKINVRIRITNNLTNGSSRTQIAVKKGNYHTHDRIEMEQSIEKSKFMDYVKLFNLIIPSKKVVLERETLNYKTDKGIVVSVVKGTKHAYIEFGKLCSPEERDETAAEVGKYVLSLGYKILDEKASVSFFNLLDAEDDWQFLGNEQDMVKLDLIRAGY